MREVTNVEEFDYYLETRARAVCLALGVKTPQELARFSESQVFSLPGVGKTTVRELRNFLEDRGLRFSKVPVCPHCGMELPVHDIAPDDAKYLLPLTASQVEDIFAKVVNRIMKAGAK